jgi:hypothetical protein
MVLDVFLPLLPLHSLQVKRARLNSSSQSRDLLLAYKGEADLRAEPAATGALRVRASARHSGGLERSDKK